MVSGREEVLVMLVVGKGGRCYYSKGRMLEGHRETEATSTRSAMLVEP